MIKLIKQHSNTHFEIEVPEEKDHSVYFHVMHDFVQFNTRGHIKTDKPVITRYPGGGLVSQQSLGLPVKIQIGIRDKEGKPSYTWSNSVIKYFDEKTNQNMVAVREKGTDKYEYMSESVYNKFYKS